MGVDYVVQRGLGFDHVYMLACIVVVALANVLNNNFYYGEEGHNNEGSHIDSLAWKISVGSGLGPLLDSDCVPMVTLIIPQTLQTLDNHPTNTTVSYLVAFRNYSYPQFGMPKSVVNYSCSKFGLSKNLVNYSYIQLIEVECNLFTSFCCCSVVVPLVCYLCPWCTWRLFRSPTL